MSPNQFIAVAERSDIIYRLTGTLLRKALAAAAQWPPNAAVVQPLPPGSDFAGGAHTDHRHCRAERRHAAAHRFRSRGNRAAADFARAAEALLALKRSGARISLDDFGTGYSSLNFVHRLPLDKIKIDRSLVLEMEENDSARDIVKTMIAMCGNLHLDCVTEGIETEEQLHLLRSVGGTMAQGYLFGKPIAPEDVARFLESSQRRSEASAHKVA